MMLTAAVWPLVEESLSLSRVCNSWVDGGVERYLLMLRCFVEEGLMIISNEGSNEWASELGKGLHRRDDDDFALV